MTVARTVVSYLLWAWVITGGTLIFFGFVATVYDAHKARKRRKFAASAPTRFPQRPGQPHTL